MTAGEHAALFRRFHRELYDTIRAGTSSSDELVEDACQHAWLQLQRRSPGSIENIPAWLTVTARRQLYKLSERERREVSLDRLAADARGESASEFVLKPRVDTASIPERLAEQRYDLSLLTRLPERQQRILLLRAAGLSHEEIAAQLKITTRTVERQLEKARATLRKLRRDTERPPAAPAAESTQAREAARVAAAGFPSPPAVTLGEPPPAIPARARPSTHRPGARSR
jgi:RNA polymerase sigma-70 factor (ECF subfamily)